MKYTSLISFIILIFMAACQPKETEEKPMGGQAIPQELTIEPAIDSTFVEDSESIANLKSFFEKKSKYGFNGTVLYAHNGEVKFSNAYGYANLRSKDPLTMESSFQLASVSKPITALAVLKLCDDKLLNLDDSVQQYIPNFPYHGISIRHLLSHRSGLSNYMYFSDEFWFDREVAITNKDILGLMVKHTPKPYYPPDRRYNYSNTNYAILALIVEEVSNMSFEAFIKLNIFLPLNMSTSLIYNKSVHPDNFNQVVGYTGSRRVAENTYLNGVVGDKGVYASALDLFKLDQALYDTAFISHATLDEAFTLHHKDLRIWDNYGLGWRINAKDPDNKIVYHSGWWKGFHTYFIRELGSKKTLIILSNTDRSSSLGIRDLLALI